MPLVAAADEAATLHSLMGSMDTSVAGDHGLPLTLTASAAALRKSVRVIVHLRDSEVTVVR
jgi:hypothetical protein